MISFFAMLWFAFAGVASAQSFPSGARIISPPPGGLPPGVSLPSSSKPGSSGKDSGAWIPSEPLGPDAITNQDNGGTNDEVQLSFQNANIDLVVKWLSETTGKSVIKHPQVHCQLTITSSKKVPKREAINLVYRALGLEGYTAIEFNSSILIVPQGQEPNMSPELVDSSRKDIPEGRQRLVKVFSLKHIQAADLKDRIRPALSDKATVEVDERANQIIISDYNDNIRVAGDLIEALDTENPPDISVRVLPLKNVSATDLMKEIGPLYQKRNSKSPKDTVEIAADELSNSLLILSSEANFRAIQQYVSGLDTEEAQEKIMRTFLLKNADAQDVAKQLQDLNEDQNSSSYPRIIYFSSSAAPKDRTKMNIVADHRRNAVIVQAAPTQMDAIEKMIKELDQPVNDGSLAPKIYRLKYASAVDIEDVLNELFLKKTQQRSYYDYIFGDGSSEQTQDVGRLYGKVRITSEPYSNTIIVTSNSKENLAVVERVLEQLDAPSEAGDSTLHIGLKYGKASTVANDLNILFAKNGSPPLRTQTPQNQPNNANNRQDQQQTSSSQNGFDLEEKAKEEGYYPWLGGQPDTRSSDGRSTATVVSDLVGRVRVVADERANALLISANVHYFPQILKLLDQMDTPSDQVSIEARILEVSSDFLDKLGVRWSPDGSQVFTADDYDDSLLAHVNSEYQKGFGGNTKVNTPPLSSGTVSQVISALRGGVVDSTISMDFLVQFLRKTTDATVLGEPQITINDNEMGKLFVGQLVPVPEQNTFSGTAGAVNTSITYKEVGVVLEVTPHINSSGDVQLQIHTESSTVVPGQTVLGGAVFNTRNFRTELMARNGQTLVLGGIHQKEVSDILRKVPILGDIPGLGWAFKKRDKTTHDVELMVFLHPKVIRSLEDEKELMRGLDAKTPLLKKWQDENDPKAGNKK
ncbi:MAG TPA: secretin N-terminal domain-containing protein [Verrucomicrobiae bacterium]|nr:secretin N-terminal domain-containing protein [Verrucomicrobiae bacterium]